MGESGRAIFGDFLQQMRRALDNEHMSNQPANLEETLFGELKDLIVRARERLQSRKPDENDSIFRGNHQPSLKHQVVLFGRS